MELAPFISSVQYLAFQLFFKEKYIDYELFLKNRMAGIAGEVKTLSLLIFIFASSTCSSLYETPLTVFALVVALVSSKS